MRPLICKICGDHKWIVSILPIPDDPENDYKLVCDRCGAIHTSVVPVSAHLKQKVTF